MSDRPEPGTPAWARYWLSRIEDAQQQPTETIAGQLFQRVRYGDEHTRVTLRPQCHDCHALIGQLHVRGCCTERCPKCGDQAVFCGCGLVTH